MGYAQSLGHGAGAGPTCLLHPLTAGLGAQTGGREEGEGKSHTADEVAQAIGQSRE